MSDKQLVYVYGTLKEGHGNHRLLESSTKLGNFITPKEFTMYSLGAFPAVELNGDMSIHGEVYEVDDITMQNLDGLEGYPRFYDRIQIPTEYGDAWMYFINDCDGKFSATKMDVGKW